MFCSSTELTCTYYITGGRITAMSVAQVVDAKGKHVTNMNVGITVSDALGRLRYSGFLETKDGIACGDTDIISVESAPYTFKQISQSHEQEDPQARFRRLAESAAINVTDVVMKSVIFHFSAQMTVVNTANQAADLYRRASRIPRSATEILLKEKSISVGNIFGGTDTGKSIILEAFENGMPRLLKIAEKESVDHEMMVWDAIKGRNSEHLVPLRKLDFERARVQVGNLSGGYIDAGTYDDGILMQKYQSTLARCTIPLPNEVLVRLGEQLVTAVTAMHECGYCHMDIKPANIFLWEDKCLLGDYGGATKIGGIVREHTLAYYPCDAGNEAKTETDWFLLAVTLLEMHGSVASPPSQMSLQEIKLNVESVEDQLVNTFLTRLVSQH